MSEQYKFANPEGLFFTTSTIVNWIDLFTRKELSDIIINSLSHCQSKKGLVIHAWCLMPSHLHMIVSRKDEPKLADIFRDFKKFTNEGIIACINDINESRKDWLLKQFAEAAAPLQRVHQYKIWQDGNHPVELTTNEMINQRLRYTHYNPVTAGFIWEPETWCYSSAIDYAGGKGLLKIELIH